MPLRIVRGDIVKIKCDAIVNATNGLMLPGGGVDEAIHKAAGGELLDYCRQLGELQVGQAKITPAYQLPCRFVIHTAGPRWQGGNNGERELLEACYVQALNVAKATKCKSIAFPLISSGLLEYPKDSVLKVACSTIKQFLYKNDLDVYLVLFDKDEYTLSDELSTELSAFLRRAHAAPCENKALSPVDYSMEESADLSVYERDRRGVVYSSWGRSVPDFGSCESILKHLRDSFALTLMRLIDEKGMDDVECYKKANVSRQTWYKILNEKDYKPNKKTVISFAIALGLDVNETQNLLSTAGFILSKSNTFDLIIMYCLVKGIYDVLEIDSILFKYDQETLASKF